MIKKSNKNFAILKHFKIILFRKFEITLRNFYVREVIKSDKNLYTKTFFPKKYDEKNKEKKSSLYIKFSFHSSSKSIVI